MNNSYYLAAVRSEKPLVHHLTNWVTIYDCAQVVKSFGASPVMAHAPEEVADMAALASALVLNIGTLTKEFVASMKLAACAANRKSIPVILDVCGAGATPFRDAACSELLGGCRIDIIRGNASEIARVAGEEARTKGVDAGAVAGDLAVVAQKLALRQKCVAVITGKVDIVADGKNMLTISNGHEMLTSVVGTGCMATSVIGTFAAVSENLAEGAAAGLSCYGIAAEIAAAAAGAPAAFKQKLLDSVFLLDGATADAKQRIA